MSERVYVPVHRGDNYWAIEERLNGDVTHICAAGLSKIQAHAFAEQFRRVALFARKDLRSERLGTETRERVHETKPSRRHRAAGGADRVAGSGRR